jgi:membrane fusion protein (multidrug efflux system)
MPNVLRVCLAGLSLVALASCGKGARGQAGGGFQMPPMPVEVAKVQPQRVRDQFRALGSIEASENIQVTTEYNGTVRDLPFTEGQSIQKGALVARFDDREARSDAQRAAATLAQAEAAVNRGKKLEPQQLISQQELDDLQAKYEIAKADEDQAKTKLQKMQIHAPWSGVVGRRRVSPGAYLRAGDQITELAKLDEMKVIFAAPERFVGDLKRGVPVEITTPAYGEKFTGRVSVVDPIIDPVTRTTQVVALVPNPAHKLKPGMSADVTVTLSERPSALVIPDEAIFAEGTQNFVYVVKPDSTVQRAAIETGHRDSTGVEVLHGLASGDVVVKAGHQKLFPGARVMPMGAEGPGGGPGGPSAGKASR